MYTRFSTQQLASLEAARRRRQERGVDSLWAEEDRKAPMSDVPEGPLAALREQSRKGVQYLLNYMLANAEQYLLGLAGKAPSKGEQANIYEAMRELRLKRRALEEKYAVAVMGVDVDVGDAHSGSRTHGAFDGDGAVVKRAEAGGR